MGFWLRNNFKSLQVRNLNPQILQSLLSPYNSFMPHGLACLLGSQTHQDTPASRGPLSTAICGPPSHPYHLPLPVTAGDLAVVIAYLIRAKQYLRALNLFLAIPMTAFPHLNITDNLDPIVLCCGGILRTPGLHPLDGSSPPSTASCEHPKFSRHGKCSRGAKLPPAENH